MDEEVITDLKQFITVTVSQQISEVRTDILRVETKLEKKIDDLSLSIADALETANETTDKQLKNHEKRITRLEAKASA